jgi:hypothetical protein
MATEMASEMATEMASEMVTDNTVELTKAAMDSFNIGVDEAMDKLKISENERAVLKKKIVSAN